MNLDPCATTCNTKIPRIVLGQDKTLDVWLTSESTCDPVDLTDATEIVAIFLNADGTFLERKFSLSQITIVSAPGGHFQIALPSASTALLAPSPTGSYSNIEIHVTISSMVTIILLPNSVNIVPRLFPAAP